MNNLPAPEMAATHPDETKASPRPPWYWLLILLPPLIAVGPTLLDWFAYRWGGGGDGTHLLAAGITYGLAGMVAGLIAAVFIAGWEVRHRSGKVPATFVAIGTFVGLQFLNLSLTLAGCTVGEIAIDPVIHMIRHYQ